MLILALGKVYGCVEHLTFVFLMNNAQICTVILLLSFQKIALANCNFVYYVILVDIKIIRNLLN